MNEIQNIIQETTDNFFNYPWDAKDFLTEDDVRCRLFHRLEKELLLKNNVSVHSEIRWYGHDEKKLKYRSDIVIIDSDDLRVKDDLFELPSKGYGFNKYYSIIEIKLRRKNNKDSDEKYKAIIEDDIEKLKEVREKTAGANPENKSYCVIVFDIKNSKKCLITNINTANMSWENWNFNDNS